MRFTRNTRRRGDAVSSMSKSASVVKGTIFLARCFDSDHWSGVKNYHAGILEALRSGQDEFIVRPIWPPFRSVRRPAWWRGVIRTVLYPLRVRMLLAMTSPSILHVTDQVHSFLVIDGEPSVVTCHDLMLFRCSNLTPVQLMRWKKRVACMRRATLVFADSKNTARDIREFLHIDESKIIVNYLGVDPIFRVLPAGHRFGPMAAELQRLGKDHLTILHVGNNFYHKNLPLLLNGIKVLLDKGVPVRLVKVGDALSGSDHAGIVHRLGLQDAIIEAGAVSMDELVELYNVCRVAVVPSTYEGFGFPVLEAQACGLPAVVSNASSLPEVGGSAALYHGPTDLPGFVDRLELVYNSRDVCADLIARGRVNVTRFSMKSHTENLMNGYRSILGRSYPCRR